MKNYKILGGHTSRGFAPRVTGESFPFLIRMEERIGILWEYLQEHDWKQPI